MKITLDIIWYVLFGVILSAAFSCNSEVKIEDKKSVKVDTLALKRSIFKERTFRIIKEEDLDYDLDSLHFYFTIDAQKIINKKIIVTNVLIDDLYKDESGNYHLTFSSFGNHLINLTCSHEQIEYIQKERIRGNHWFYITMIPSYVKKLDYSLVSNVNDDYNEETDQTAKIEMEESYLFKIKGQLLFIKAQKGYNSIDGISK